MVEEEVKEEENVQEEVLGVKLNTVISGGSSRNS